MCQAYLNQCWVICNWAIGNIFQWNFNQNSTICIEKNPFENAVWNMSAILSWPQCVNRSPGVNVSCIYKLYWYQSDILHRQWLKSCTIFFPHPNDQHSRLRRYQPLTFRRRWKFFLPSESYDLIEICQLYQITYIYLNGKLDTFCRTLTYVKTTPVSILSHTHQ